MWLVTAVAAAAGLALCCMSPTASGTCVDFVPVACFQYHDPGSTYCSSCGIGAEPYGNLCCNLHWEEGELTPTNLKGYHEVTVIDARTMVYHVPCEPNVEHRVYFQKVEKAILMGINDSHYECNLHLISISSNFDDLPGLMDLLLVLSNVTYIHHSQTARGLLLDRSNVAAISNITVFCDIYNKPECFSVENSHVGEFQDIFVDGYALIINSAFGTIYNMTLVRSLISNVTVQSISTAGLTFLSGYHNLRNIEFKNIEKTGLYFSENTDVVLNNIKIINCEAPCILINSPSVTFRRLVINGNEVMHLDKTKYVSWIINRSYTVNVNSSTCIETNTTVECNLEMYSLQPVEFEPIFTKRMIRVYNHQDVQIDSNCFQHLWLEGISGHLRSIPGYGVTTKQFHNDRCDVDERKLTITQCYRLTFLHLDVLSSIRIIKSTIQSLDIESPLDSTAIIHSNIGAIENMMTQGHAEWSNVVIDYISNLFIGHPALFVDTQVLARISNVTINHESKVTIMRNCFVDFISYKGLNIVRGDLQLENCSIHGLAEEAIDIEESGRLLISTELRNDEVIKCLHPPGIRVYMRSQVVFQRPENTPPWLFDCIKIRTDKKQIPKFLEAYEPIMKFNCASDLQNTTAFCDMKGSEREYLLGYTNELDAYRHVQVTNTYKLHVGHPCFDEIHFENIEKVFIHNITNSCFYKLCVVNCTVDSVSNNVYHLMAKRSKFITIAPDIPMSFLSVQYANITNIEVTLRDNSELNFVTVLNVINVKVESIFVIKNTYIEVVHPNGFAVKKGSHLMLENCMIKHLHYNGFNIYGVLTMKNVTVAKVDKSSILTGRNSQLFLTNVHFAGIESINVFGVNEGPDYNLDNVTVAGKLITVSEKLVISETDLASENTLDNIVDDVEKIVTETGENYPESDEPFESSESMGNAMALFLYLIIALPVMLLIVAAIWCIVKIWSCRWFGRNHIRLVESGESINEAPSPGYGGTTEVVSTTSFNEPPGASSITTQTARTSEGGSPESLSGSPETAPTLQSVPLEMYSHPLQLPTSERVSHPSVSAPVADSSSSTASNVDRPVDRIATTLLSEKSFVGKTAKSIQMLGKAMSLGKSEEPSVSETVRMSNLDSGAQNSSLNKALPAAASAQSSLQTYGSTDDQE